MLNLILKEEDINPEGILTKGHDLVLSMSPHVLKSKYSVQPRKLERIRVVHSIKQENDTGLLSGTWVS